MAMSKLMKKLLGSIMLVSTDVYLNVAHAGIKIDDFKGTNGAGTKKVDDMLVNGKTTLQNGLDFVFYICTFVGIVVFALCWYKMYQASKDEGGRGEKPASLIIGMIVGGGLTSIGLICGYFANTLNA